MHAIQHLSLKQRIIFTGVLLAMAPLLTLGIVFWRQFQAVSTTAQIGSEKLAGSYLTQAGETAYNTVWGAQNDVASALRVALASLDGYGGLQVAKRRHTTWQATNQETHETRPISLPLVTIGRKPGHLPRNAPPRKALVDDVHDLTGASCAVFQRMTPEGDMLRIATTVLTADGKRATGTYIPVISSSGKPNPVLAAVLEGKEFAGTAIVEGKPYMTSYAPIKAGDGTVMGMIYTGIPEIAEAAKLQERLSSMRATGHGEVFALSTAAATKGQYLFRSGQVAGSLPDGAVRGRLVDSVLVHPSEASLQHYQSSQGVPMVAHMRYFAPWKWLLGVAIPEQEYLKTPRQIDTIVRQGRALIAGVFFASLLASVLIWTRSASKLTQRLIGFAQATSSNSGSLLAWAKRLRASSDRSAGNLMEQVQSVARSSARIQQVAGQSAKSVAEALQASRASDQQTQETQDQLASMRQSMEQLNGVNTKISGLMKDIDEIAFQSRILALNARIEAARAGEAGVSFGVVADQFGSLAERCAQAAKTTTDFLTESSTSTREGLEKLQGLGSSIQLMASNGTLVRDHINQVHAATAEQVRASAGIAESLSLINEVVEHNTHLADQSAEASSELQHLAGELHRNTRDLSQVVQGGKPKAEPRPQLVPKTKAKQRAKKPAATPRPMPVRQPSAAKAPANNRSARRAC